MSSFSDRAQAILETACAGDERNLTVICQHDGGLRLIMGSEVRPQPEGNSAIYQVMRKDGRILVTGRQGLQTCALEGSVPPLPPFLLNNQALYRLAGASTP